MFGRLKNIYYFCFRFRDAAVAQLVEHQLPKLRVAGSNPVCRSAGNQIVIKRFLSDFCF